MCALGDRLEYRHYPGLDHGAVVAGSLSAVTDWIEDASRTPSHPRPALLDHVLITA
jgi:hypothetical protein